MTQIRQLGRREYASVYQEMMAFTQSRSADSEDEIWIVEHDAVYTQGHAGRPEHVLDAGDIPIVKSNRGGQVTYHGPGQLVVYPLLDLRRLKLATRKLVSGIEQALIDCLAQWQIVAMRHDGAPGVYVGAKKIASIGLRVSQGCCYHGLALNVDMDLEPFSRINPCGYTGLVMTQIRDEGAQVSLAEANTMLLSQLRQSLRV